MSIQRRCKTQPHCVPLGGGCVMRRVFGCLVIFVALSIGLAAPASAEPSQSLNREVGGTFRGPAPFEFGGDGCDFVLQTIDASFHTSRSRFAGSLFIEGCVDTAAVPGGFAYESGTFTLTTRTGAILTGTVSGEVFPLDLTLTVTDGTRRFRHVSGTIAVEGTLNPDNTTGTLTGSLRR